jgi:hypothetical protein
MVLETKKPKRLKKVDKAAKKLQKCRELFGRL